MDGWSDPTAGARMAVIDEPKSAKVTYANEAGETFRVVVHQKPNPIGFTARLPGSHKDSRL